MVTYTCDRCGKKTEHISEMYIQKVINVHLGCLGDYCVPCFQHLSGIVSGNMQRALDDLKRLFALKCAEFKNQHQFFGKKTVSESTGLTIDFREIFKKES